MPANSKTNSGEGRNMIKEDKRKKKGVARQGHLPMMLTLHQGHVNPVPTYGNPLPVFKAEIKDE